MTSACRSLSKLMVARLWRDRFRLADHSRIGMSAGAVSGLISMLRLELCSTAQLALEVLPALQAAAQRLARVVQAADALGAAEISVRVAHKVGRALGLPRKGCAVRASPASWLRCLSVHGVTPC